MRAVCGGLALPCAGGIPLPTAHDLIEEHLPANDDFDDRLPLAGATAGTFKGASVEADEPYPPCAYRRALPYRETVWYSFTAPADGRYVLSTNNLYGSRLGLDLPEEVALSGTPPVLGIHRGDAFPLDPVAFGCTGRASVVLAEGEVVHVQLVNQSYVDFLLVAAPALPE